MKLAGELNFLSDLVNEISVVKILARQYYLLNENVHSQNTKKNRIFSMLLVLEVNSSIIDQFELIFSGKISQLTIDLY